MPDPKVMRTFRIPLDEWDAVRAVAEARGENVSDIIRAALRRYVMRHAPK